jgi:hypothetical protein
VLRHRAGSARAILGGMRHPHLGFVVALLLVGPLLALAGMSATGAWQPLGVGAGALVVAMASARSTRFSYRDRTTWYPIRWRMTATTAVVTVAAMLVALFSVVSLLRVLTS